MSTLAVYPDGAAPKANVMPMHDLNPSPDFEKVIESCGGYGEKVEAPDDLLPALRRAREGARGHAGADQRLHPGATQLTSSDEIAIVGGGVAGLALALNLHGRGISCTVYERAPQVKELGVGITLLPHAMREFAALGLADELLKAGLETRESCFFNRFGQLIYREDRGRYGGYAHPEVAIHRGRLHMVLYRAACAVLGDRVRTNHDCVGVEQDENGATVLFKEFTSGRALEPVRAGAVIACDGISSVIRRQFYPDEEVAFAGINTWRGVTRRKPIFDRPHLHAGRLDPHRQDRDLSDHRRG